MSNIQKNNKPNVPNLRFPEFSGEWKKIRVSDLLEFFSTNSLSWDQLEYGGTDIFNLHYGLIHSGLSTQISLKKSILPSVKSEYRPRNYTLCEDGDVAFADASEDTNEVGKVVEFVDCAGKEIVCGLHTIHGRDKLGKTVVGFKGYAFSSPAFHNQIRRIAQGTKIFSINTGNFAEIFIGVPQKEEQDKISHLLSLLDQRIAIQNRIIEKYESLIKAIRRRIFASIKANTYMRLGDIAPNIASGKSKAAPGNITLFGSTGIIGTCGEAQYSGELILVARVGSVGHIQLIESEGCGISDNTIIINAGSRNRYVYYFLRTFDFAKITSGTTQPLITGSSLKEIEIPLLSEENSLTLVNCLMALDKCISIEKNTQQKYIAMKKVLLADMFI